MKTEHLKKAEDFYEKVKSGLKNNGLYPLTQDLDDMRKYFKKYAKECEKQIIVDDGENWTRLGTPEEMGLNSNLSYPDDGGFKIVGGLPTGNPRP